jgi:NAD(P)H-nitrite reductase large subunit
VICVDIAGAAGLDIKGTEVLGLMKTEEALEHIVALTQMYRDCRHSAARRWRTNVPIAAARSARASSMMAASPARSIIG